MQLRAAARSDVGRRRPANEDTYALAPELGLFLVADGMGGHRAGHVASGLAARAAVATLRAQQEGKRGAADRLRACVAAANAEILSRSRAKPELAGMGTTIVALLADGDQVALAHVGDSRAYLIRDGAIRRLTEDHTVVGELVRRGEISEWVAGRHPQRHVLLRALGVIRTVDPDLLELAPVDGDLFLLCSDGLTGHVEDEEIAELVAGTPDLDAACGRLVDLANGRGGDDNITVVLLRCEPTSESSREGA
jgi:serine/threonine protein phosphatase PrpC